MLAVLTVQNNLDDTLINLAGDGELSLREAIEVANNPGKVIDGFVSNHVDDEITFDAALSGQTILLSEGELLIEGAVVIDATALSQNVTIDAQHQSRVFNIYNPLVLEDDFDVKLAGLNIARGRFGGIRFFSSGTLTLEQTTVSENDIFFRQSSAGRAVRTSNGSIVLIRSTISNNGGGGIFTARGSVTLLDSTVSGNTSFESGGGIATSSGVVSLTNSTVSNNSSSESGGGIHVADSNDVTASALVILNSIVAGNSAVIAPDLMVNRESALDVNYSLIGDTSESRITASTGVGNLLNVDPLIAPLADNGGGTLTHALYPTSPAIDAGNSTSIKDQRGRPRPFDLASLPNTSGNGADMGAFELQTLTETLVPDEVRVVGDVLTNIDLSKFQLVGEDGGPMSVTLSISEGTFADPSSAVGVIASLVDPQTLLIAGSAHDLNVYLDDASNLQYTSAPGDLGDDSATIDYSISNLMTEVKAGSIPVDIVEFPSFIVNTAADDTDEYDGVTSLRDAILLANAEPDANTITFDSSLAGQIIELNNQISITSSTTINATDLSENVIISAGGGGDEVIGSGDGFRHFLVDDNDDDNRIDVVLRGLTLTGGDPSASDNSRQGGSILNREALIVENSAIDNNAAAVGAAIYNVGTLAVIASTLSANTASFDGGGIYNSGTVSVTSSTLSGNSASRQGGGLFNSNATSLMIASSTLAGNSASEGAGIFSNAVVNVNNSIVANSHSGGDIVSSFVVLGSHNLIGDGINADRLTDSISGDPLLAPLADNGGPTYTHALTPGSPAIDSGNGSLALDQRGLPRPIHLPMVPTGPGDGSDIGALEMQAISASAFTDTVSVTSETLSDLDLSTTLVFSDQPGTVTFTLTASDGVFAAPIGQGGVNATLLDPQTVVLAGVPLAINNYLEDFTNLRYTPAVGALGKSAATVHYTLEQDTELIADGTIIVDIYERQLLSVSTTADEVDPFDGVTSLREAIELANETDGQDSITFSSSVFNEAQTIQLASQLPVISDALTINGPLRTLTIDAGGGTDGAIGNGDGFKHFVIDNDHSFSHIEVLLIRLTLTGGDVNGPGGSISNSEVLTLDRIRVERNFASIGGGISNSRVLNLTRSTVSDNSAFVGGGLNNFATMTISLSSISGNSSVDLGGGIYNSGTLAIDDTTISGNTSFSYRSDSFWEYGRGGGIFDSGRTDITDTVIAGNSGHSGGGIYSDSASLTLVNSTVTGNSTLVADGRGGGIYGQAYLTETIISENSAAYGGGIYTNSSATITSSTFSSNSATEKGGGISGSRINMSGSALFENTAGVAGGAMYIGSSNVANSTLSGNTASEFGGGIYAVGNNTIDYSTIVANSAGTDGGGIYVKSGTTDISGTIVANSSMGGDLGGVGTVDGLLNLIGDGSRIDDFRLRDSMIEGDPRLGPLADNGGPTLTYALLPVSPAFNAGLLELGSNPDPNDQRGDGFSRVSFGRMDIGAYELQPFVPIQGIVVSTIEDTIDDNFGELSLREAIYIANSSPGHDLISFDAVLFSTPQTITLTHEELDGSRELPTISESLTIIGPGPDLLTIDVDARSSGPVRVLTIDDGDRETEIDVRISGLTATGGYSRDNGGGIWNGENLTITNSVIQDNRARDGGGGIANLGTLNLFSSTIRNNRANRYGGGILNVGTAALTGSTIAENNADRGGGFMNMWGVATITASTISANTAGSGGGVANYARSRNPADLLIAGSSLTDNVARVDGGAIHNTRYASVELSSSLVTGNSARDAGGGIHNGGRAIVIRAHITGNTAQDEAGGAIVNLDYLFVSGSTLSGNASGESGGGIHNVASARIDRSTISGNSAGDGGGGIFDAGNLEIKSSTMSGNIAVSFGGGLQTFRSTTVVDSTFSGNSAAVGGGIWVASPSTNNRVSLYGSIVANSLSGGDLDGNGLPSGAYNLIGDGSGSTERSNWIHGDPLLGPLQDNGGPTFTHALLPGSPALDAGNSAETTDQRGLPRSVDIASLPNGTGNGSDIGAFELQTFIDMYSLPADVRVELELPSDVDLSTTQLVTTDQGLLTLTLIASAGVFELPDADDELTATLVNPQTIELVGTALAINTYLDDPSNIQYTGAAGALGEDAAAINYSVDKDGSQVASGSIYVDVFEPRSLIVTTAADVVDSLDLETSLREALAFANSAPGHDTITFDMALSGQSIVLVEGELKVFDGVTIDALALPEGVTIDADGLSRVLNADIPRVNDEDFDVTLAGLTMTGADDTGIRFVGSGIITLDQSTVIENAGTGISTTSGSVVLKQSHVSRNFGQGIGTTSGTVTLADSTVAENSGGISTSSGSITVSRSIVSGNSRKGNSSGGGGIRSSSGNVALNNSTVSGNSTTGHSSAGGGIYTLSGNVTLDNSTVSGNSTTGSSADGAGIYTSSGAVTISNVTVTDNSSGSNVGGILSMSEDVSISNSIVAGNTSAGSIGDLSVSPSSTPIIRYSVVGDTTPGLAAALLLQTGNLLNVDPLLGPLQDNGGPTFTHALLPGSPALDAGNSAETTDQRGLPRSVDIASLPNGTGNGSDIGAFELQTFIDMYSLPADVRVELELPSDVDLSTTQLVTTDQGLLTLTLIASAGVFELPDADDELTATLVNPQTIELVGTALAINTYLDDPSNIQYTGAAGALGEDAAAINYSVDKDGSQVASGSIYVDVFEPRSLIVTTAADVVDSLDLETSLREALAFANSAPGHDTITFDMALSGQSIVLVEGELKVFDGVTIDALALPEGVTIDADGLSRVLNADIPRVNDEDFDVTLAGLTMTGGNTSTTGGGILFRSIGMLSVSQSSVTGNASGDSGGGISSIGDVTLVGSTVTANSTSEYWAHGGGIYSFGGAVTLNDSTVSGNVTMGSFSRGGGIYTSSSGIILMNSTVSDNVSAWEGGGIYTASGNVEIQDSEIIGNRGRLGGGIKSSTGEVTLSNSTVSRNTGTSGGGISTASGNIWLYNSTVSANVGNNSGGGIQTGSGAVTLISSWVTDNTTLDDDWRGGGGIFTWSGPIIVDHSMVHGNTSSEGGGIYTASGAITLNYGVVRGNTSSGLGGGVYTASGVITLNDSVVSRNTSFSHGGGIFSSSGSVTLLRTTVSENTSSSFSGSIYTSDGEVRLVSSTVSDSSAIAIQTRTGPVTLANSTVSGSGSSGITSTSGDVSLDGSTVSGNVGGIHIVTSSSSAEYAIVEFVNSIVAGNTARGTALELRADADTLFLVSHSLIGNLTNGLTELQLQRINDGEGNLIGVDPLLGRLAENGGPTRTHALLPGSPAIDAGDPGQRASLSYDQRGFNFARVVGGRIDIGAYEAGASSADFDADGDIDGADFLTWQRGFTSNLAEHANGDSDLNGTIDFADLANWSETFGFSPRFSADFNLDGGVNGIDFLAWQRGVGTANASYSLGDANFDGVVNSVDLDVWTGDYQRSADASVVAIGNKILILPIMLPSVLLDSPASMVEHEEFRVRQASIESYFGKTDHISDRKPTSAPPRAAYRNLHSSSESQTEPEPWLTEELLDRVFG